MTETVRHISYEYYEIFETNLECNVSKIISGVDDDVGRMCLAGDSMFVAILVVPY